MMGRTTLRCRRSLRAGLPGKHALMLVSRVATSQCSLARTQTLTTVLPYGMIAHFASTLFELADFLSNLAANICCHLLAINDLCKAQGACAKCCTTALACICKHIVHACLHGRASQGCAARSRMQPRATHMLECACAYKRITVLHQSRLLATARDPLAAWVVMLVRDLLRAAAEGAI